VELGCWRVRGELTTWVALLGELGGFASLWGLNYREYWWRNTDLFSGIYDFDIEDKTLAPSS
jgi:hypothetical protein